MNFQGTKTFNMNSPNQMEQFGTNIIHFDGLNSCQRRVSFFIVGIQISLSLSLSLPLPIRDHKIKIKIKIRFCTKIELKKC